MKTFLIKSFNYVITSTEAKILLFYFIEFFFQNSIFSDFLRCIFVTETPISHKKKTKLEENKGKIEKNK